MSVLRAHCQTEQSTRHPALPEATRHRQCWKTPGIQKRHLRTQSIKKRGKSPEEGDMGQNQNTGTSASGLLRKAESGLAWTSKGLDQTKEPAPGNLQVWTSRILRPALGHLSITRDRGIWAEPEAAGGPGLLPVWRGSPPSPPSVQSWEESSPGCQACFFSRKGKNPWDSPASLAQGRPSPGLPIAPPPQHLP